MPVAQAQPRTREDYRKVLVVDDNDEMRGLLEVVLGAAGTDVTCAGDGEEALTLISVSRPDLVVTDMSMPRMDGLALCAHLRNEEHEDDIPVLVLTALPSEEPRVREVAICQMCG